MPEGARLLTIRTQGEFEDPYIWALVDSSLPWCSARIFHTYGTGHSIPDPQPGMCLVYVSTYLVRDGDFVWHVFEEVEGIVKY